MYIVSYEQYILFLIQSNFHPQYLNFGNFSLSAFLHPLQNIFSNFHIFKSISLVSAWLVNSLTSDETIL